LSQNPNEPVVEFAAGSFEDTVKDFENRLPVVSDCMGMIDGVHTGLWAG
jgi:hypothetical protein